MILILSCQVHSERSIVYTLTNDISATSICIVTEVSLDAELFRKERMIILDNELQVIVYLNNGR
jgi:hypothetical protein